MLIPTHILPNPYEVNVWGCREQLTKQMVSDCLSVGLTKSLPLLDFEDHTSHILHASRVGYFVTHLWEDPIIVEMHRTEEGEQYAWPVDGCHRLSAAIYLGVKEVLTLYNEDVFNFINCEVV